MTEENNRQGFVDIHTHILPAVDDGAQSVEQALKLLHMAFEDGTRAVVLTPHFRGAYRCNTAERLEQAFSTFQQLAAKEIPEMELYLGCEVHYQSDISQLLSAGQVLSMNHSDYALLEFRYTATGAQIVSAVSEVGCHGFVPIVAHAERYDAMRKDVSLVDRLLDQGARIQLNADSVLGKQGFGVKRYCHHLLKTGRAHFIASDTHNTDHRPPLLAECYRKVSQKYGHAYAAQLFYENARAMVANGIV